MPSGGKRQGAGRPVLGRRQRTIYATDDEMVAIRELLERLRREKKHEKSEENGGKRPE